LKDKGKNFPRDGRTDKEQKEGGMKDDFRGSVQKELIEKRGSFFSKYSTLFIGKKGFFSFLRYECVTLLFSGMPGALGFFLRKIFYPSLFKQVGKGVIFGRNVTVRHPKKITIGDNTSIDDNVVLDAKGETNEWGSTVSWPGSAILWPGEIMHSMIRPFRSCSNPPIPRGG
jgi:acetyltransferase-like isoleucine patch superfamily enzyme